MNITTYVYKYISNTEKHIHKNTKMSNTKYFVQN